MDFFGSVIQTAHMDSSHPSVLVRAFHDPTLETWARWQTDLRDFQKPEIGNVVRVRISGGVKIAY